MLPSLLYAAAQNPAARNSQSELVCAANAQDHDVDGPRSTFDAQYHHHQDYLGRREQGAEAARAALDTTSVGTRTGCKCNTSEGHWYRKQPVQVGTTGGKGLTKP